MLTSWFDIFAVFMLTTAGLLVAVCLAGAAAELWSRFQGLGIVAASGNLIGATQKSNPWFVKHPVSPRWRSNLGTALVAFLIGMFVAGTYASGRFNSVKLTFAEATASGNALEREIVLLTQKIEDATRQLRSDGSSSKHSPQELQALLANTRKKVQELRLADCPVRLELSLSKFVSFKDEGADTLLANCKAGAKGN